MLQVALCWTLGVAMILAGLMHFRAPGAYVRMMPAWLPAHRELVLVSGVFEVLGGLGVLIPATRTAAAWGLVALFIAVFPANLNMALKRLPLGRRPLPVWVLWARLPLQLVFIAWAYALT
jgi:uncharacterized membrane protein